MNLSNQDGIELKVGMRVKGYLIISRTYGRTYNKDIEGVIIERNNQLYVNSFTEPEKNYPLYKFKHNFLTHPKIVTLEVLQQSFLKKVLDKIKVLWYGYL